MRSSTRLYPGHNTGCVGIGFGLTRMARRRQLLGAMRREWTGPLALVGRYAARTRRPRQ
ncbi:hypothetical protein ABZ671_18905 [Micromonospora sp. NPDC006766]|uniref:hypothetical protein n=1 Tax=Micromonospora sp. NPDC006766 TaxID=3154778 RepID=UPI0034063AFE